MSLAAAKAVDRPLWESLGTAKAVARPHSFQDLGCRWQLQRQWTAPFVRSFVLERRELLATATSKSKCSFCARGSLRERSIPPIRWVRWMLSRAHRRHFADESTEIQKIVLCFLRFAIAEVISRQGGWGVKVKKFTKLFPV